MSAIRSGAAHMPLPIWARPRRPQARPISTFWSSYALIHTAFFISPLRTMGPTSIEVWISSPVRSKKPVLMNTTRSLAAWMQAARFALVRRSSSMMPILSVLRGRASNSSVRANNSLAKATSSGPCSFGLTIYIEPARLLCSRGRPRRSCVAISAVITQSRKVSGVSWPWLSSTASVYMWWPTLRTSIRLRPATSTVPPPGAL